MPRATRKALAEDAPSRSSPRASTRASTAAAASPSPAKTRGRRGKAEEEPEVQEAVETKTRGRSTNRGKTAAATTPSPSSGRQSRSRGKSAAAEVKKTPTPPKRGRGKAKKEEPEEEEEEVQNEEEEKQEEEEEEKEITPKRGRGRAQAKGKSPSAEKSTPPARGSRTSRRSAGTPVEEDKEEPKKVTPRGRGKAATTPPSRSRRGRGAGEPEEDKAVEEPEEKIEAEEEKTDETGDTMKEEAGSAVEEKMEPVTADVEMKSEEKPSTAEETVAEKEPTAKEEALAITESQTVETAKKEEPAVADADDQEKAETPIEKTQKAEETESTTEEVTPAPAEETTSVEAPPQEEPMEEAAPAVSVPVPEIETTNGEPEDVPPPPRTGMKRKLEEDSVEEVTEESDAKRVRLNGTETEGAVDNVAADVEMKDAKPAAVEEAEGNLLKDYVLVNKDEVPAPDSAEVAAAVPQPTEEGKAAEDSTMEVDDKTVKDDSASGAEAVTVVPLTEAEVAKAYASDVRAIETDDVSSTIVEVGSVAGSDITGGLSRGLDISELQSASNSIDGDHAADTSINESSTVPETTDGFVSPAPQQQVTNNSGQPDAAEVSDPVPEPTHTPTPTSDVAQSDANNDSGAAPAVDQIPVTTEPQTRAPSTQQESSDKPVSMETDATPVLNSQPNPPVAKGSSSVTESLGSPDPAFLSTYSSPGILNRAYVPNPAIPADGVATENRFSIVSYNILAECHRLRSDYSYTAAEFLGQEYRHNLIMKELQYLNGDIVCLQEVGNDYYNTTLLPAMRNLGYNGLLKSRTKEGFDEGEATFYKSSAFDLVSCKGMSLTEAAHKEVETGGLSPEVGTAVRKYLDRADVVLITQLRSKASGKIVTVGNIHIVWDLKSPDVQCIQAACAIKEVVGMSGSEGAHIICGDFNSEWSSPVYQLVLDGYLSDSSIHTLQAVQKLELSDGAQSLVNHLWRAFQHTSSNLKSAYSTVTKSEPEVTTFTRHMKKSVDYVFYSTGTLVPVGVMKTIDRAVIDTSGGLPSKDIPSDHLAMKADMAFSK